MENEIWKDIVGFVDIYQVSNLGRIKSLEREVVSGSRVMLRKERILKTYINSTGYELAHLKSRGKTKRTGVHRLVMAAFVGESILDVNHIDSDRAKNSLDNLEYCSKVENMAHAEKVGRFNPKGSNNVFATLDEDKVRLIREMYAYSNSLNLKRNKKPFPAVWLAKCFGVQKAAIFKIVSRRTWRHI